MSAPNIERNSDNQVECSICSYAICQPRNDRTVESGVYLPCTHFFGMRCLARALVERQNCPICRMDLPRDILIDLQCVDRGMSGSVTGDRATTEPQRRRELDIEQPALGPRTSGRRRRRADSDEDVSPRSLFRPHLRGSGQFPGPQLTRERPTIAAHEQDENEDIVERPRPLNNYPIRTPSTPSARVQPQCDDDPYSSLSRFEPISPWFTLFYAERARQLRSREAAASASSPRSSSICTPASLSREEQYRQPFSTMRRNAIPNYYHLDGSRRPLLNGLRRSISPPPSSRRSRDRKHSFSTVYSGHGSSNRFHHVQSSITRTSRGNGIVEATRNLALLGLSDRGGLYNTLRRYEREREEDDDELEQRALMERALNDPNCFGRGDRCPNRGRSYHRQF